MVLRKIATALISVYDKSNLESLIPVLKQYDVKIISSGGTANRIRALGYPPNLITDVSAYTGFPESPDGLVKTYHPKVLGALLMDPNKPKHKEFMVEQEISVVDLLVVNLYPFQKAVDERKEFEETVEMIDIGGPGMLRGAAKRAVRVGYPLILTDPSQYKHTVEDLTENQGSFDEEFAKRQGARAFALTSNLDAAIAEYLRGELLDD